MKKLTLLLLLVSFIIGAGIASAVIFPMTIPSRWHDVGLGQSKEEIHIWIGRPDADMRIKGEEWFSNNAFGYWVQHIGYEDDGRVSSITVSFHMHGRSQSIYLYRAESKFY